MSKKNDYAKKMVEGIIEAVENGAKLPWQQTWSAGDVPRNALTGRAYRGINVWLTLIRTMVFGYTSNRWLTMKQANAAGGRIKKGEKPTWIVFWKERRFTDKDDDGEETTKTYMMMRVYKVWNVDQCQDLDENKLKKSAIQTNEGINPIEACESIVAGYKNPPKRAAGQPSYRPSSDTVRMPAMNRFDSSESYYSTLFHELAHSTGHETRLKRASVTGPVWFGSETYSREELVAEMSAAMLCGHAGIDNEATTNNTTAYLQGWVKALKEDPNALVDAAQAAQKAVDHILGTSFKK